MKEQEYHIDVTAEEDKLFRDQLPEIVTLEKKKPTIGRVFWIVAGAHIAAIGALLATCSAMSPSPTIDLTKPVDEMPQSLSKELNDAKSEHTERRLPVVVPNPRSAVSESSVDETETKQLQATANSTPNIKPTPSPLPTKAVAKEYVVKKGDTIYSISKKFKLNTERLLKINNIKDPNKILVGQKLKFM